MNSYRNASLVRYLGLVCVALFVQGCVGEFEELYGYIRLVKEQKGGPIPDLPEAKHYETYVYSVDNLRSPFIPYIPGGQGPGEGPRPDIDRTKEFLEEFPLDSLRMVGTLASAGDYTGLVQTTDGLIHRVRNENYMGQNDGRIVEITDSEIRLVEIIPDGLGGYLERPAAVALEN
ncbi:MAG: pilus assembly protein PilP [Gammaproteobacteria bacterium]